jgi:hypothetical protein
MLATAGPGALFGELLPWLVALVLAVVAGAVVIYLIRRAMGGEGSIPDGFSLHELRRLREAGQLTDEEFERAKASVIGRLAEPDEQPRDEPNNASPSAGGSDTSPRP